MLKFWYLARTCMTMQQYMWSVLVLVADLTDRGVPQMLWSIFISVRIALIFVWRNSGRLVYSLKYCRLTFRVSNVGLCEFDFCLVPENRKLQKPLRVILRDARWVNFLQSVGVDLLCVKWNTGGEIGKRSGCNTLGECKHVARENLCPSWD